MRKIIMLARYALSYIVAVATLFLFVEFMADYAKNPGIIPSYGTKGFSYLLVLLFSLMAWAFFLYSTRHFGEAKEAGSINWHHWVEWFQVPETVLFHQGHTWAVPDPDDPDLVRVGLDDFAQRIVGKVDTVATSRIGMHLRQGEKSWSLLVGDKVIDMLSPISGRIVEVNQALRNNSAIINNDPFGAGWIYKIKARNLPREKNHLFSGELAKRWMEGRVEKLRQKMEPDIGLVFQDGGVPVSGMARMIAKENWDELVREFFLT